MRARRGLGVLGSLALLGAAAAVHAPAVGAGGLLSATTFEANGGTVQHYTVPTSVCEVLVEAWGGNGDGGGESDGGVGGKISANFLVTPGTTLDVFVGEHGDGVTGGAGFDAGGSGSVGGAGGGGSSAVVSGSEALVVAGGGGGGGSTDSGGNGGDGANDGSPGSGTGHGAGGVTGDPHATGDDATVGDDGGGGGAGAGPGGGASDTGGGGGGASSKSSSAEPFFSDVPGTNPVDTGDGAVRITPQDPGVGCPSTLQVKKVVDGPGTTGFEVQVNCTRAVAEPHDVGTATVTETTVDHVSLPYTSDGTPDASHAPSGWVVSSGSWQLASAAVTGSTCTVTETDTGGAASVSYACTWTAGAADSISGVGCPGTAGGPSATPQTVVFEGNGDFALVTVGNTFPVVVQPTFTG